MRRADRLVPLLAALLAGPALAQEDVYLLTRGDRLEVSWVGASEPSEVEIDLDGQIRLIGVGPVAVAGLSLDQAEAEITARIDDAGQFVSSDVTVAIGAYAPVAVAGDVASPGRFEFFPGMTVATALGFAGGSRATGVDRLQLARAQSELEGRLRNLMLEMLEASWTIARLEAQLAGQTEVELSPEAQALLGAPDPAVSARFQADAQAILTGEAERIATIEALSQREIEALNRQADLLRQRIEVQSTIVQSYRDELDVAEDLQNRGLQTAAALSRAQQLEADARAEVLELESALVGTERGLADAERGRVQVRLAAQSDWQTALATTRGLLEQSRQAYDNTLADLQNFAGGNAVALIGTDSFTLDFAIVSSRGQTPGEVTLDTPLLPGDALLVTVERGAAEPDNG